MDKNISSGPKIPDFHQGMACAVSNDEKKRRRV
jgi:hypothetical protein